MNVTPPRLRIPSDLRIPLRLLRTPAWHLPTMPKRSAPKEEERSKDEKDEGATEEGGSSKGAKGGVAKRGKARKAAVDIPEPKQLCFSAEQLRVRIGTSGYSYSHWRKGVYYPQGLPAAREFEMYSREFDMLELNATFYGWFKKETFDAWRDRAAAVRPSFTYVVKTSQFYTHKKRLNVDDTFKENWGRFWERCQRLRPHLGPVLFQFPSNFKTTSQKGKQTISNIDKLRRLGEVLPAGEKFVFEFRDASWYCAEVYEVLRQHDWCLALVDVHFEEEEEEEASEGGNAVSSWAGTLRKGPNPPPDQYPLDCCSWGVYVRYHGSAGQYQGTYGKRAMEAWAQRTAAWLATGRTVYHAFNNDSLDAVKDVPSAILDCRHLAAGLRMRFDKSKVDQSKVAALTGGHDAPACTGEGCAEVEEVPFCIPADGVKCKGCAWDESAKKCFRNNCDALFTPKDLRQQQKAWKVDGQPQLLISAGPERSGSTWLYNAVRLLFQHAQQPLDAYWLTKVTDSALDVRGVGRPGAHHVLIKTLAWSEEWDLSRASHIFITHRDLRQVVRSYRRLGWESDLPRGYVEDHLKWREHAELDIAFEDIVGRPHALVKQLAERLGLLSKVDVGAVVAALNNLPVPTDWVDPVTQMWPSHISTPYEEERRRAAEGKQAPDKGKDGQGQLGSPQPAGPRTPRGKVPLSEPSMDYLKQQYSQFFELYGYS